MTAPVALMIPTAGDGPNMVTQGYVDALRYMGWTVLVRRAKWRQEVRQLIEQHGVQLIFTCCRYGLSQLPIKTINDRGIGVVIQALMFNKDNESLGGTTECVDPSDPNIVASIGKKVVHTSASIGCLRLFHRWWEMDEPIIIVENAGNILRSVPESMFTFHDISMVMNLAHRSDAIPAFIDPMLHRLRGRYRFNCYGDQLWNKVGISAQPLPEGHKRVATIYGQSLVCPNIHTSPQRVAGLSINERTYAIAMAGGNQVCDSPLVARQFDGLIESDPTPSGFIQAIERNLSQPDKRFERTMALVRFMSEYHTYFNRIQQLAQAMGMKDMAEEAGRALVRVRRRHIEEIERRIAMARQGIVGSAGSVEYLNVH